MLLLFPLLALTLCVSVFMNPASASATVRHAFMSKPQIFWGKGHYQHNPPASGSNLTYHGGPVMAGTTQIFAIFWEPTGTFVDSTYNDLLKRYFGDVGGSPLYHNNIQYPDQSKHAPQNATLTNTWVDTAAYPVNPDPFQVPLTILFDSDIQNEVTHALTVNHWNAGINHIFFVFLALNSFLCIDATFAACSAPLGTTGSFCAYHFAFGTGSAPVIYAAMPYAGNDLAECYLLSSSPNNDAAADAEINVTSHEQIEAATDPLGDGWYGPNGLQDEIGDKCAYQYQKLNPDGSNVSWGTHPYIVQSEWDNTVSGCVLQGP